MPKWKLLQNALKHTRWAGRQLACIRRRAARASALPIPILLLALARALPAAVHTGILSKMTFRADFRSDFQAVSLFLLNWDGFENPIEIPFEIPFELDRIFDRLFNAIELGPRSQNLRLWQCVRLRNR